MLEDKPSTESVVTETPPEPTPEPKKEPSSKDKAFQEAEEIAKKWRDAGVAVSLRDYKGRKAGQEFKILSVEIEKGKSKENEWSSREYHWIEMTLAEVESRVCLGCISYDSDYDPSAKEWRVSNWVERTFLVTLEESKLPQHQKEIEAWKNPELTFKIRQKEGKPCYTIWFSHNGYTKGVFQPVRPDPRPQGCFLEIGYSLPVPSQLLELDSLEAAREVVEILKTREKVEDIAYFTRQFADVSGEFYTVETIISNSKEP